MIFIHLFNHGVNLLPYTGAGSGITRALQFTPDIQFDNNETLKEFVITINREPNLRTEDRVQDSDKDDRDKVLKTKNIEFIDSHLNDRVSDKEKTFYIPYKQLSGIQKDIIQYCSLPRTAKEILLHIGYHYHSTNISKWIKPLLDMHYIEQTVPNKPNSKNQKYRKVR